MNPSGSDTTFASLSYQYKRTFRVLTRKELRMRFYLLKGPFTLTIGVNAAIFKVILL